MFEKAKKIAISSALPIAALAIPASAMAQSLVPDGPGGIRDINDITAVIRNAIRFVLLVAFILAFVFLIFGGIRWITAGGDEKAVGSARGMITAALIGLVVVLVSYALIVLVETFFNVTIISGDVNLDTIPRVNTP